MYLCVRGIDLPLSTILIFYLGTVRTSWYFLLFILLIEYSSGDRFTKVIVNRKSKITLKISLRARIRAFH
jgi:hypothetical protein